MKKPGAWLSIAESSCWTKESTFYFAEWCITNHLRQPTPPVPLEIGVSSISPSKATSLRSQATSTWPSHMDQLKASLITLMVNMQVVRIYLELLLGPNRACVALVTSTKGDEQSSSRGDKRPLRSSRIWRTLTTGTRLWFKRLSIVRENAHNINYSTSHCSSDPHLIQHGAHTLSEKAAMEGATDEYPAQPPWLIDLNLPRAG